MKQNPYPLVHNYLDPNGDGIHLTKVYSVMVFVDGVMYDIDVVNGFHSDLASTPRIVWSWLPPHGKYSPATVVHDFLIAFRLYSRKIADRIFREMLIQLGVRKLRVRTMYMAVRISGSLKKNRY